MLSSPDAIPLFHLTIHGLLPPWALHTYIRASILYNITGRYIITYHALCTSHVPTVSSRYRKMHP